jgi:diaminohydroxyphosphoribosylaminopyrimidine deaminase/5-amino-6-(5-phosphoribosylamino)uracil reductase
MDNAFFMRRCLDLASNGLGTAAPNPMVGAVIVYDGRIIGEGFHTACGMPHAEVEAFGQVRDKTQLPHATLFVNLEPCSHHGRTPPCTDLILKTGIRRVVIGQTDPNGQAAGGAEILRSAGIEVVTGVMTDECRSLNRRFNTFHEKKRPYILLKWAQTTDGYVDKKREIADDLKPLWITDETCRMLVHKWRSEEQSIMAGSNTILLDNPELNVRCWAGKSPLRVTIDRTGRLSQNQSHPLRLLDGSVPSIIYTNRENASFSNLEFKQLATETPVWEQVFSDLYSRSIQSVLVEGGPTLVNSLIAAGLWDEARVFIGPAWFGEGVKAPALVDPPMEILIAGNSKLLVFHHSEA